MQPIARRFLAAICVFASSACPWMLTPEEASKSMGVEAQFKASAFALRFISSRPILRGPRISQYLRPPTLSERLSAEQYRDRKHRKKLLREIEKILASGWYVQGEWVRRLEHMMAEVVGVNHAIATGSGTEALIVALMALEIGPGDEVLMLAVSYIAPANAVLAVGAKPVFVDIDPVTFQLDIEQAETFITKKTKAIVPIYLYGQGGDMDGLESFARKHGIKLIGDMAQALGATYKGRSLAVFGDATIVSLDPTKVVYSVGKGGILFTDNAALAALARSIRSHGSYAPNLHDRVGINAAMQEIPAMTFSLNLPRMKKWITRRQQIADLYRSLLKDVVGVDLPAIGENRNHTYWQYVIRLDRSLRSALAEFLKQNGIENWRGHGPGIFYPEPMPFQKSMARFVRQGLDFPNARRLCNGCLCLPIFPGMTDAQIRYVATLIIEFFRKNSVPIWERSA